MLGIKKHVLAGPRAWSKGLAAGTGLAEPARLERGCNMVGLKHLLAALLIFAAGVSLPGCALFQGSTYPASDITLIVPFAAGGVMDAVGRALAQESEPLLGRKIVILNKAGASGSLGAVETMRSKPDGYTLGFSSLAITAMQPQISELPYRGPEDFAFVMNVDEAPHTLSVRANAPWRSLEEFVAEAKRRPGELRVGNPGKLTAGSMLTDELSTFAGIKLTTVPFAGGAAEAIAALLGGHIEAMCNDAGAILPQVKAGQVRMLAIVQGNRTPALKDIPLAQEKIGFKSKLPRVMHAIIAPKGTDKAIIDKLYKTFSQAAKSPRFEKVVVDDLGMGLVVLDPDETTKLYRDSYGAYTRMLKELGIELLKK